MAQIMIAHKEINLKLSKSKKMRKKIFSTLTVAALVLISCSNKNETTSPEPNPRETKSVYLQIDFASKSKTKSDEPSQAGEAAPLYSALIYFLDGAADPIVFDYRTISANGNPSVTELEEGYRFDGIPSSVTQVYVIGNYNTVDMQGDGSTFPMVDGIPLSQIQEVVLNIEQNNHGALRDATTVDGLLTLMDGRDTIDEYVVGSNTWNGDEALTAGDLYANVEISPIVARIEIDEIEYTGTLLQSMTIEGIYINYYYQQTTLDLDYTNYSYTDNGSDVSNYDSDPENDDFAYRYYMSMFDQINNRIVVANGRTTEPDNGTWAYHVFGDSSPVPHIILKVTDIVAVNNNQVIGTRYVTVKGYLDSGNDEVTEFDRNTIYRIATLQFSDDDLEIFPETESKNVWVHVEVAPWVVETVTPII